MLEMKLLLRRRPSTRPPPGVSLALPNSGRAERVSPSGASSASSCSPTASATWRRSSVLGASAAGRARLRPENVSSRLTVSRYLSPKRSSRPATTYWAPIALDSSSRQAPLAEHEPEPSSWRWRSVLSIVSMSRWVSTLSLGDSASRLAMSEAMPGAASWAALLASSASTATVGSAGAPDLFFSAAGFCSGGVTAGGASAEGAAAAGAATGDASAGGVSAGGVAGAASGGAAGATTGADEEAGSSAGAGVWARAAVESSNERKNRGLRRFTGDTLGESAPRAIPLPACLPHELGRGPR